MTHQLPDTPRVRRARATVYTVGLTASAATWWFLPQPLQIVWLVVAGFLFATMTGYMLTAGRADSRVTATYALLAAAAWPALGLGMALIAVARRARR